MKYQRIFLKFLTRMRNFSCQIFVHDTRICVFAGVVKNGAYKYDDSTKYIGDWNRKGLKHGAGLLVLPDGTRYEGAFQNGLCSGLGVIIFPDGAK